MNIMYSMLAFIGLIVVLRGYISYKRDPKKFFSNNFTEVYNKYFGDRSQDKFSVSSSSNTLGKENATNKDSSSSWEYSMYGAMDSKSELYGNRDHFSI